MKMFLLFVGKMEGETGTDKIAEFAVFFGGREKTVDRTTGQREI